MKISNKKTTASNSLESKRSSYARAGVDIALGNRVKSGIGALVRHTHGAEVLGGIGGFGGLFRPDFKKRGI